MKERDARKREVSRREFLRKALWQTVGFGLLAVYLGKFLPKRHAERVKRPNLSLKEASHASELAG